MNARLISALRRRLRDACATAAIVATCACAAGGSPSGGASSARTPLGREEIGERMGLDVYEIVRQLRPSWLQ
ncbi:MAG: hypothetical protein Q8N53_13660, partial [Longimicrobiales bacterium]|nr:hypothetical protein [Longimicrobiales bacterium]